jgi:CrcB protein
MQGPVPCIDGHAWMDAPYRPTGHMVLRIAARQYERIVMSQSTDTAKPYPFVNATVCVVVFVGGALGTGLRYAMSFLPVIGSQDTHGVGSFHLGTFLVNMIASCCYAGLVTYLAQAPWIHAKRRELISRGFGMGVCGGLSTLSALALEVFTSSQGNNVLGGMVYLMLTFAGGFIVALLGVRMGNWLVDHRNNPELSASSTSDEQLGAQR